MMKEEKKYLKEQRKKLFKKYEDIVGVSFHGDSEKLKKAFTTLDYTKAEIIKHYNDEYFPHCNKEWAEKEYKRTIEDLANEFKSQDRRFIFFASMAVGVLIITIIALL